MRMWKNIVEPGRPHVTIWRMRIACWMPKRTNTHSECVILIGFPLQQWLHERTSVLRYTYIACFVNLGSKWKRTTSRPSCFIVSDAHGVGGPVGCRSPLDTLNRKNLWSCDPAVAHIAGRCLYDCNVSRVLSSS
jgi:hypothetical protein